MKLKLGPMLPVISVIALIVCCPMEPSKSSSTLQWPCSLFTYGLFCCSTILLLLLLLLYADIAVSRFISVGFSRETNHPNPNRLILKVFQKQKYHQHLDVPSSIFVLTYTPHRLRIRLQAVSYDLISAIPIRSRRDEIAKMGLRDDFWDIWIAGLNRVILRCSRRPLPR